MLHTQNLNDFSDVEIERLRKLLSDAEIRRNASFRQEAHRRRDIACRGTLRLHLSRLLELPARDIRFSENHNGKPYLLDSSQPLYFNYSHSGDYAAFAYCRGTEIGVDIEYVLRRNNLQGIARHFFAPAEVSSLDAIPESMRRERFFQFWTLKEAYLKARGEGIFLGLDKFCFELDAATPSGIGIAFESETFDRPDNWQFHTLTPVPNYRVSIAAQSAPPAFEILLAAP